MRNARNSEIWTCMVASKTEMQLIFGPFLGQFIVFNEASN